MNIHLLQHDCKIPSEAQCFVVNINNKMDYEDQLLSQVESIVSNVISKNIKDFAIIIESLISDENNRSYVSNTIVDFIEQAEEKISVSDTVNLYLLGAIKSDSKFYSKIKDAIELPVYENCSFYESDDKIKKFEKYQANLEHDKEFRCLIYEIINDKKINKVSDIYKKAGISRSVFSRITNLNYENPSIPTRSTLAALAIGLKLNLQETMELYKSAGYYFGNVNKIDRIIRYFIEYQIYDIDEINRFLIREGLPMLGARSKENDMDLN